jgi:hypothetical protein
LFLNKSALPLVVPFPCFLKPSSLLETEVSSELVDSDVSASVSSELVDSDVPASVSVEPDSLLLHVPDSGLGSSLTVVGLEA